MVTSKPTTWETAAPTQRCAESTVARIALRRRHQKEETSERRPGPRPGADRYRTSPRPSPPTATDLILHLAHRPPPTLSPTWPTDRHRPYPPPGPPTANVPPPGPPTANVPPPGPQRGPKGPNGTHVRSPGSTSPAGARPTLGTVIPKGPRPDRAPGGRRHARRPRRGRGTRQLLDRSLAHPDQRGGQPHHQANSLPAAVIVPKPAGARPIGPSTQSVVKTNGGISLPLACLQPYSRPACAAPCALAICSAAAMAIVFS